MFWGRRLKKVVNFFGEEKCTPEKIVATPMVATVDEDFTIDETSRKEWSLETAHDEEHGQGRQGAEPGCQLRVELLEMPIKRFFGWSHVEKYRVCQGRSVDFIKLKVEK